MKKKLNTSELKRYSRHIILDGFGIESQLKLKSAKVLVVGAGGLGSPVLQYLCASGVGVIGVIDSDIVDETNIHRQIIHTEKFIGLKKIQSVKDSLNQINPHIEVNTYDENLTSLNAFNIINQYDIVIDGTDNFPSRYLINDVCVLLNKPNVHGSIYKHTGQVTIFSFNKKSPCYRCLFPLPPPVGSIPDCSTAGVLGVLPGVIGILMATEAIKIITGIGVSLSGRILLYDALKMEFREIKLNKDTNCLVCGANPTITELIDYQEFCSIDKPKENNQMFIETTVEELNDLRLNNQEHTLIDVREANEFQICNIEGALLIPMAELKSRIHEVPENGRVIIHCHHGSRSARVCAFLNSNGYNNVENLKGGIDSWSTKIDSNVPRY